MKQIKILQGIKEVLTNESIHDVPFEDHDIGDTRVFKLHYVNHYKRGNFGGYGVVNWPLKPFSIPDGMSREDAFKVLSYLTDFIEHNMDVEECSFQSVKLLDEAINLERFGFRRVDEREVEGNAQSLYTVAGRQDAFKNSKLYDTYFEWYQEGVTRDEVASIYSNMGMEFKDLVVTGEVKMKKLTDK